MIRINITKHAYDRMKERLGFSKKAAARMADVAYLEGISHRETNGRLNKYISSLDGISKKLEKDKYLVILRKKAISQLRENRFDLLEEVKTVNIGNEMAVTISVGMGCRVW